MRRHLAAGRSPGCWRGLVWIKVIMPEVWPRIRLPVLAVLLLRLVASPDIGQMLPASAEALVQALLVVAAFALLWFLEGAGRAVGRRWVRRGGVSSPSGCRCRSPRS